MLRRKSDGYVWTLGNGNPDARTGVPPAFAQTADEAMGSMSPDHWEAVRAVRTVTLEIAPDLASVQAGAALPKPEPYWWPPVVGQWYRRENGEEWKVTSIAVARDSDISVTNGRRVEGWSASRFMLFFTPVAEPVDAPRATLRPLFTMSELDWGWCQDLHRAEHSAFSLVTQYLQKCVREIQAQRAEPPAPAAPLPPSDDKQRVNVDVEAMQSLVRILTRIEEVMGLTDRRWVDLPERIAARLAAPPADDLRTQVQALVSELNDEISSLTWYLSVPTASAQYDALLQVVRKLKAILAPKEDRRA